MQQAGLVTAALAAGMYDQVAARPSSGTAAGSLPSAATDDITSENGRFTAALRDHGRALTNPGMGWTMHFYSNILSNYGSQARTVRYAGRFSGAEHRLPAGSVGLSRTRGRQIRLGTARHPGAALDRQRQIRRLPRQRDRKAWLYHATPKWVFDAGATGYDVEGHYLEPDYEDPVFIEKVENFLRAMAERYDRNPHVAFVDVGHFGMWGEGHTVMSTPKHGRSWGLETQKKHIDLYCKHFKNTQLCISDDFAGHDAPGSRFPITDYAFSRGVTIRDDSILVQPPPHSWYHSEMAQLFWPTLPVILEHEHYGGSKERGSWDKNLLVKSVEDYHASFMSIHWWPRILLEENRDAIDRINRRIGYRLQVSGISWPESVKMGEPLEIRSAWSNAGVAPCYRGGHPCFTLKDDKGGIVSALVVDDFDLRSLPVCEAGKTEERQIVSTFRIAPRYADKAGTFFRACKPGVYDLYVSAGMRDGTPVYELPYNGNDGRRRYKLGRITVSE